jgi:hypothetical protein
MTGASATIHFAAANLPLLHRGERLAFIGLLLGGWLAVVTRKGLHRVIPGSFGRGQYQAAWFLKFAFLLVGIIGLGMMVVAST